MVLVEVCCRSAAPFTNTYAVAFLVAGFFQLFFLPQI